MSIVGVSFESKNGNTSYADEKSKKREHSRK